MARRLPFCQTVSMYVTRPFGEADREALIALWQRCELTRAWNDPSLDIDRKLVDSSDGLLVAEGTDGAIVASVMVGHDGHRGWVNYVAVDPAHQRQGIARQLMVEAEQWLLDRQCPKLNLQVRAGNIEALAFYESLGYTVDACVSMGKRLIADE